VDATWPYLSLAVSRRYTTSNQSGVDATWPYVRRPPCPWPCSTTSRGEADPRVTRYDLMSIWEIATADRYGRSDINEMSIGISLWNVGYRYEIWCIDVVINHIDMVILDIDMGYGLMLCEISVYTVIFRIDVGYFVTLVGPNPPDLNLSRLFS